MNLENLQKNLEAAGFTYRYFPTAQEAGDYLVQSIHGKTVGLGGSMTLDALNIYDRLAEDNQVYWHWRQPEGVPPAETIDKAQNAQVYLSSVNGIAETGELINIDGTGNRISATMSAKEAVYFVAGVNKVEETFDKALWRARNVASPLNARRIGTKTPCVLKELKCYDCKSPERICRGLTVLWRKLRGVQECVVVLVGEDLGY